MLKFSGVKYPYLRKQKIQQLQERVIALWTSCAGCRHSMLLQVDLWPFDLESGVRSSHVWHGLPLCQF